MPGGPGRETPSVPGGLRAKDIKAPLLRSPACPKAQKYLQEWFHGEAVPKNATAPNGNGPSSSGLAGHFQQWEARIRTIG